MMVEYVLRLALLLPLLAAFIWGSLWLTRFLQTRLAGGIAGAGRDDRKLELVETNLVAPGLKLAVVRFHDREILLGCSRSGLVRLAEAPTRAGPICTNGASTPLSVSAQEG